MPIRHYTIDPPFNRQPSDTFILNGKTYEQWRSGALIDSRDLTQQTNELLTEPAHFGDSQVTALYLEEHMPGVAATLTRVVVNETTGAYTYKFSDGIDEEFSNRAAALLVVQGHDTQSGLAKQLLILQSLRKDNGGSNPGCMEGSTLAIDGAAVAPVSQSRDVGVS